jgi:BolA protein
MTPDTRKTRIETILAANLAPLHLEVSDESSMHSVPPGAESHFKVIVVSEGFGGTGLVARHRRVNALLMEEFQGGLHALGIHAWTPGNGTQRVASARSPCPAWAVPRPARATTNPRVLRPDGTASGGVQRPSRFRALPRRPSGLMLLCNLGDRAPTELSLPQP